MRDREVNKRIAAEIFGCATTTGDLCECEHHTHANWVQDANASMPALKDYSGDLTDAGDVLDAMSEIGYDLLIRIDAGEPGGVVMVGKCPGGSNKAEVVAEADDKSLAMAICKAALMLPRHTPEYQH